MLAGVQRPQATCGASARALVQQQGLQVCMRIRACAELGAASLPLHEVLATRSRAAAVHVMSALRRALFTRRARPCARALCWPNCLTY